MPLGFKGLFLSFIAGIFCMLSVLGCKNKVKPNADTDTPVSGEIAIVADESFAPLIKKEVETFSALYPEAKINMRFLPEYDAATNFYSDRKLRLLIIPRKPGDTERKYFEQLGLPPHATEIAIDAIAIIVNASNPDSMFTYGELADLLSGKIGSWKQVDDKSPLDNPMVVFDNAKSSTVRYMLENVVKEGKLSHNAFAVDSNPAVISYVRTNPAAIGVIGASWLLRDDLPPGTFDNIKIAAISARDSLNRFYRPVKKDIYSLKYPFLREVYIVSQEAHQGLGTGFATFVASDEGQRIVSRYGLMPADNALRIIELKNNF